MDVAPWCCNWTNWIKEVFVLIFGLMTRKSAAFSSLVPPKYMSGLNKVVFPFDSTPFTISLVILAGLDALF